MEGVYILLGLVIIIGMAFIFLLVKRRKRSLEEVKRDPSSQAMWPLMQ
jgi:LPXTG-motif cell wall-anchored protein